MQIPVTEFKAKCTRIFRDIEQQRQPVEITRRGKVIAVIQPPDKSGPAPEQFLGCLGKTLSFHKDWDQPLGEDDWEACE